MSQKKAFIDELYASLSALSRSAFPKHCPNCGCVYKNELDFIQKTHAPGNHSGLKSGKDENENSVVELYRNCVCGSTLMDFFRERRDLSEQGQKRREIFGKLLEMLEEKGLPRHQARQELLAFMHGKTSRILEEMGVNLRETDLS